MVNGMKRKSECQRKNQFLTLLQAAIYTTTEAAPKEINIHEIWRRRDRRTSWYETERNEELEERRPEGSEDNRMSESGPPFTYPFSAPAAVTREGKQTALMSLESREAKNMIAYLFSSETVQSYSDNGRAFLTLCAGMHASEDDSNGGLNAQGDMIESTCEVQKEIAEKI
ncbi:hypothetical protein DFH11DRAFT_1543021 [Phellopilus nigrolimitatus]|nr:hypothetical protein DFH11DRAFT_1543021 [Phellopilus nigrolimitatus]